MKKWNDENKMKKENQSKAKIVKMTAWLNENRRRNIK